MTELCLEYIDIEFTFIISWSASLALIRLGVQEWEMIPCLLHAAQELNVKQ